MLVEQLVWVGLGINLQPALSMHWRLQRVSGSWSFSGIRASCRHTCRRYLQEDKPRRDHSAREMVLFSSGWIQTWEEGEHHRHPAHDVGPGEAPAAIAFAVVVDRHPRVHGHGQQHEETWGREKTTGVRGGEGVEWGCLPLALTGNEEEDAGSEGLVKPIKGGVVDEGHDADDDADETSQEGEDHKGPGGVPVGCVCVCVWWGGRATIRKQLQRSILTAGSYRWCPCVSCISRARSTATGPGACNCWSGDTASSSPSP